MLGIIIEQNGDGLLEQSHMPVGWPLHIDGSVWQSCTHRDTTLQALDNLLGEYDLKRDLVEINRKAPNGLTTQYGTIDIWSQGQVSPYHNCGRTQSQLSHWKHPSYEVKDNNIRRAVMALTAVPAATLPESTFLSALGTPAVRTVPPQTGSLAQRAIEEWERNLCQKKAVAILEQMQAGKPALIKKMEERCSLPSCLTGHSRRQKHGGSSWCLHPSDHQDHARQTESPSYCTNDQARGKRWPTTLGESS